MIDVNEIKAVEIDNETFLVNDKITVFWITNSNSFRNYIIKNNIDDEDILSTEYNEMYGVLKGWNNNTLQIGFDEEIENIPFTDIDSVIKM